MNLGMMPMMPRYNTMQSWVDHGGSTWFPLDSCGIFLDIFGIYTYFTHSNMSNEFS